MKYRPYVLAVLACASAVIWFVVFAETPAEHLRVSVLNVGQGDAILIDSPTHTQVLVDGGPGRSVLSALPKVMPFFDRSIDLLVISNPDEDHIAGFLGLANSYKIGAVLIPGTEPGTEIYQELIANLNDNNIPVIKGRRGERVDIGGGAYVEVLFPDRNPVGLETNTGSLVAKLVYGKTSMLLTGDAPTAVEEYLVRLEGKELKSNILKVAHHGSKNSASLAFFGAVSPQYAAISVGAGNSYGHPNKETLDELNQLDIKILRTDQTGTLNFVSDGEKIEYLK